MPRSQRARKRGTVVGLPGPGVPPPCRVVAFATDADNAGGRALAYFGDITLDAP
jgi:hypothetical protein